MATAKFKWVVEPKPTGPYSSFHHCGWPSAFYKNEQQNACAHIQCMDEYSSARAKTLRHAPLIVRVAKYSDKSFHWVTLPGRHLDLPSAKLALSAFLEANPEFMPAEYRKSTLVGESTP